MSPEVDTVNQSGRPLKPWLQAKHRTGSCFESCDPDQHSALEAQAERLSTGSEDGGSYTLYCDLWQTSTALQTEVMEWSECDAFPAVFLPHRHTISPQMGIFTVRTYWVGNELKLQMCLNLQGHTWPWLSSMTNPLPGLCPQTSYDITCHSREMQQKDFEMSNFSLTMEKSTCQHLCSPRLAHAVPCRRSLA